MDPDRWARVEALFHEAAALPEGERVAFLERADPGLAAEVRRLLAHDSEGGRPDGDRGSPIDRDLADLARDVLDEPSVPERIGPYRVHRLLGAGGMGVVYLAERPELGGRVAIKVLRHAMLSPKRRTRFENEQRSLVHLEHPSIVRLYDAAVLPDGTPYFVMEYVEGLPLEEYCEVHGLPVAGRLALFRAVCEAVRHAHALAIIHRDLKPSNVLVTADRRIKLLDFGIAKRLADAEGSAQTETALRMMTPAYAAPEQLRGETVGVYTDVYALGVILYELLAGRRPYELTGLSPLEAERVLAREPDKPSVVARGAADPGSSPLASLGKGAAADLDVLCLTAMHRDPERRYPTVDALIRDLDRYERGEPLDARPDAFSYRLGKFARRNRGRLVAAGAIASFAAGLVLFNAGRISRARDATLAEAARTDRIQQFMLRLFSAGDPAAGPADSLRVVTLLERGVVEAGALAAEPDVQAELYRTIGTLYQGLGELERADSLLGLALDGRRSLYGPDHALVAEVLVDLGMLRSDQGAYDEAEALAREAVAMLRAGRPPGDAALLRAETGLGHVLQARGEYDRAIEVLQGVVSRQGADAEVASEGLDALAQLANTYYYVGEYTAFDSLNRVLLDRNRRRHGETHPSVADNLMNLGAAQFQWGRYGEAEELYRRALDVFERHYGPGHPETASAQTAVGRALVYQDRAAEAVELLERALETRERTYGPVHTDVATTRNDLASVALQTGDLDGAETQYSRVVEIYREVYGDDHYYIGIALSNLASVHLRQERYAEAESIFRGVLSIFERELPAENPNLAIARIKLGRALLRQDRYAETVAETGAAYRQLSAQTDPSVSWLESARTDLIEAYEALGRTDRADELRAERDPAGTADSG